MRNRLIELHSEAGVLWNEYLDECINEGIEPEKTYDEFHADYLIENGVKIATRCKDCGNAIPDLEGYFCCCRTGHLHSQNHSCGYGFPKVDTDVVDENEINTSSQVTFEKWETRSSSTDLFYGIMNKDIGIVGTFGVSVYDEGLGVGSFEILEPYRNKGFGTAAIKQIVKMFSNDFDLIYCYVDSWNESAIRFYERLGKVYKDRLNELCQHYVELYKKEGEK